MELLNDMALFVEVVKARGFRRAAEAISMPNLTLSRRISDLEKAIGLRLLHRTTRKIEVTEAGQLYYERCRRIVDEARIAHEELSEALTTPCGLLRVSLPVDLGTVFMAPLVAEFARRYPGISFEFDLTPRHADLVAEPLDIAIRMGQQADSGLIAREIGKLPRFLYASPAYLARAGRPEHPSELARHECLRLSVGAEHHSWTVRNGSESVDVEVGGRFSLNNVGMMRRLATLDMGIVVQAEELVREDVTSGRLQRVLPGWELPPIPVFALTETRLLPARTQRFIEFLREGFVKSSQ